MAERNQDDGLFTRVSTFLSGVRKQQSVASSEPLSTAATEPETPTTPLPFAVAVESIWSIEELAQLLHAANNEIARLEQLLPAERTRAEAAFASRNTAGLEVAWNAERELTEALVNQRERQRILRERMQIVTQAEVQSMNADVRRVAENISAQQRERADRLVQAVKAIDPILSELDRDAGRELAAAQERASAKWEELVARCAGFSPSGVLALDQAIQNPRLDRLVSALEEFAARLRALQRD